MTSLARFQTKGGVELVVDTQTGESFCSVSGYARMSGLSQQSISKRVKKLHNQNALKIAQVDTGYGFKLHTLITEDLISEWIVDDNPAMAKQLLKAGVRVFLHQLAGYQVNSTAVEQQPHTPQTYIEALKALVAAEEEKELLRIENAQLEEETERLSEVVDELFDYSSIIRVAKYNQCSEKLFSWRKLKNASAAKGLEVKKVPCPRFETKNLYHHDAWRYVYPDAKLPETTTLVIKPN